MRRIFIAVLILLAGLNLHAASISVNFTSDMVSSTDTEVSSSNLQLRTWTINSDYITPPGYSGEGYYTPTTWTTSADVPSGVSFTSSLRGHTYDQSAITLPTCCDGDGESYTANTQLMFGGDSALLRIKKASWWLKVPYHHGTSGTKYVYTAGLFGSGLYAFHAGYDAQAHDAIGYFADSTGGAFFSYTDPSLIGTAAINNVWIKYTGEADYTNGKIRWYINDSLRTSLKPSDTDDAVDITNGWLTPYSGLPQAAYTGQWGIGADSQATRDASFADFDYYFQSDLTKYKIRTGTRVVDIPLTSAESTIGSATLSWVTGTTTDSDVTFVASRDYAQDATITVSSHTTGHDYDALTDVSGNYHDVPYAPAQSDPCGTGATPTYWEANDTTGDIIVQLPTARAISYIQIKAVNSPTFSFGAYVGSINIYASSNGTDWGSALYTGTYSANYGNTGTGGLPLYNRWMNISFTNETAYSYYKISCGSNGGHNPAVSHITLRDGNVKASSSWVSTSVRTRYSTDNGSNWSSWTSISSGGVVSGVSNLSKTSLKIQAEITLSTDNQEYRPYLSSMTLETTPTSLPALSNATVSNVVMQ